VPGRAVRLHRVARCPQHPSMKMREEVRLSAGEAELGVRYVGCGCDVACAARRYNRVVCRGSSVSMDVGFGVFAASRSRLLVHWLYGIDL
jgi:hypothetical protein